VPKIWRSHHYANIKVIPDVSNYRYAKFGEFWTSGRPPFWISKFKRLKILEIRIELGLACQSEPPSNWTPSRWPHAHAIAADHMLKARAPPAMCSTLCSSSPQPTCTTRFILSMPRPVLCSPPHCALLFPSPSCRSTLQSPPELPPHAAIDLGCCRSKRCCSRPRAPPSSPCHTASSTSRHGESLKHRSCRSGHQGCLPIADHLQPWPDLGNPSSSFPSSRRCSSTREKGISLAFTGWHR
jgi:hypothetical protein